MINSLWGEEFFVPDEKEKFKKISQKIAKPKETTEVKQRVLNHKSLNIKDKLAIIYSEVRRILGHYADNTLVIRNEKDFISYIDSAITCGYIAIDTETNNSLDPISCKLMGPCLYVPGLKQAYIPVNHITPDTRGLLENQLTEEFIKQQFQRLIDNNVKIIMHNGKFDYQVLKCTCGIELPIYWDTLIGAKVLDENEYSAKLKEQYISKIDPTQEKYSIEELFADIEYAVVDPEIFALYAATDSMMTFKLYQWQKERLEQEENKGLHNLFTTIEMPLVVVIAEMELTGMEVDQEYAKLLSKKYHTLLDELDVKIAKELELLEPKISAWRLTPEANFQPQNKKKTGLGKSKSEQLSTPVNLASPSQLAILFYDVLKCPTVSTVTPRGTGEDILKEIAEKTKLKICEYILDRRELSKLITTYIDVIPDLATRWEDGRVRTHFNQYGAATGRLSSSDPLNFQNIPAKNKEIRMLFKAKAGHKIIGGDYSAQEPRLTAFYSQDEQMIKAYLEGKDLYAVIASSSFDYPYEECLEFYPEGTVLDIEGQKITCGHKTHQNKAGKQRRNYAKSILLGILYGRGAASIGEQIGKSYAEAQEIIDKFFKAFPKVQKWINTSIETAHKVGYVEDIAGRRRRLPDIFLPKYSVSGVEEKTESSFNPFLGCKDRLIVDPNITKYEKLVAQVKNKKDYETLKARALAENIKIRDNTEFIAQAERQSVNSRVQGGAATLTKMALIAIHNDPRRKEINAKLINSVHDEILIEAPAEYAEEAEKLLIENMIKSAATLVYNVPMKCDAYCVDCWYLDEFFVTVENEFSHLLESGLSDIEAFETLCKQRMESTRDQIYEIVHNYMKHEPENVNVDAYK